MLQEKITYTDYNGDKRTENFYFNLTDAELTELELSYEDGFSKTMMNAVRNGNGKKIMQSFTDLLLRSYGEKSEDGRYFLKSDEIKMRFKGSPAFDVIFNKLLNDPDYSSKFVNTIVPANRKVSDEEIENFKRTLDLE